MKNVLLLLIFFTFSSTVMMGQLNFNNAYDINDFNSPLSTSEPSSMVSDASGATVAVFNVQEGPQSSFPLRHDVHVLKIAPSGAVIWSVILGGEGYDDRLNSVCQTDNGGYLLVGSRGKFEGTERSWVVRLDANGAVVWDQLYFDGESTENLLVQRTSEAAETYFIAGTRLRNQFLFGSESILTALKIDGTGGLIWSNLYEAQNLSVEIGINDRPTSMVEVPGIGFVIVGLDGGRILGEVPSFKNTGELFSIGIRLNGTIFRPYRNYDILRDGEFNTTGVTEPHINFNNQGNGFVVAFGLERGAFDLVAGVDICFMPLNSNLRGNQVFIYPTDSGVGRRGHSIYDNGNGGYAIGCSGFRTDAGVPNGGDDEGVSFLSVGMDAEPLFFVDYSTGANSNSTFMVQTPTGYVLNVNQIINGVAILGMIGVTPNGQSDCADLPGIQMITGTVQDNRIRYIRKGADLNPFNFFLGVVNSNAMAIDCSIFSSLSPRENNLPISSTITEFDLKVYPTVTTEGADPINLEFNLPEDATVKFSIVNAQGQLIKSFKTSGIKGFNKVEILNQDLSPGVNSILIQNDLGNSNKVARVIKF